eukprot:CAMPEP_0179408986 /NCGR_PEP_ID=MMETSP0799-20121207/2429_1 /TAXON_ID=46947 /ORGANISM="Geminigera cryophila, Strain CCMP2564" /LENGTH=134 /DNA_ID=CAMNT_0021180571 /DNA_START=401 /DNA_END=801 /DNA_ORIENTATION=-
MGNDLSTCCAAEYDQEAKMRRSQNSLTSPDTRAVPRMHSSHSSAPHQAPTLRFELQGKSPGIQSNTGGGDAPIVPQGSEDAGALNDDILVSSISGPTRVSMETHPIVRIRRPAIVLNPAPDRYSSDTRATPQPA